MKVGIIGCGGIAPLHIDAYKRLKGIEVVGLCDLNLERAKILAAKYKVENTFTNYWDMFKKDLDLVDICTPVSTHAKIACDASEVVPAILLEKPMASNVAECDKIIKKVNKNGRKLCIGHSQLFSPHIQKAKRIVDSKGFNLYNFIISLRASFKTLRDYNLVPPWNTTPEQKGIIWEVCCHHAYLQLHFLPDINEVYALGGKVKYPVYDDFAVLLRTSSDSFGIIELSWISHAFEVLYEFRNRAGRSFQIQWEYDYMLETSEDPPFTVGLVAKKIFNDEKRLLTKWARFANCYMHKRKLLPTLNLISSCVESIEKDLPPPVPPEDGKKTIHLLECIEKSLDEQHAVKLSY